MSRLFSFMRSNRARAIETTQSIAQPAVATASSKIAYDCGAAHIHGCLLRHIVSFAGDTVAVVTSLRRTCKTWSACLSDSVLRTEGGIEAVSVTDRHSGMRELGSLHRLVGVRTQKFCVHHRAASLGDFAHFDLRACESHMSIELMVTNTNTNVMLVMMRQYAERLTKFVAHRGTTITSDVISWMAHKSRRLTHLDVRGCLGITDASIIETARACPDLSVLRVYNCANLTDASIVEIARMCPKLTLLDVGYCPGITNASIIEVARGCPRLEMLQVPGCAAITHSSIVRVVKMCASLTDLNAIACRAVDINDLRAHAAYRPPGHATLRVWQSPCGVPESLVALPLLAASRLPAVTPLERYH